MFNSKLISLLIVFILITKTFSTFDWVGSQEKECKNFLSTFPQLVKKGMKLLSI